MTVPFEGLSLRHGRRGRSRCGRRGPSRSRARRRPSRAVPRSGRSRGRTPGRGLVVDRRREDAVMDREHAHHRLDRAGRPEAVAGDRLRRRDGKLVRVVAEDLLDRLRLGQVAERRGRPVGVDVADLLRLDPGAGRAPRASSPMTPTDRRVGLREVVGVVRRAVADHLGVDRGRRAPAPPPAPPARARAAPSPITKPARVASNGREARGGFSSSAASPRIAQNPARISGVTAASAPAGEDGVGIAAADDLRCLADRGRAGRARRHRRVVRAAQRRA